MANNARRYTIERTDTRQSGMTTITTTTIVTPTLIDAFSATTFSYSAITTSQLAAMTDVDYISRLNDYLTLLEGINLVTISNLIAQASFFDPICATPVALLDVAVSCEYPPIPPTGGTQYTLINIDNGEGSGYVINMVDNLVEEDDYLIYELTMIPSDTANTITCNFNYGLTTVGNGGSVNCSATIEIEKNGSTLVTYFADSGTTYVTGNSTFLMISSDIIKVKLRATAEWDSSASIIGGAISSFEIYDASYYQMVMLLIHSRFIHRSHQLKLGFIDNGFSSFI
ncbi:MAG: hypothetical protein HC836_15585 [Richelia sp. RM2_1_2]|nr:hypothetical protein [Richelia sp. RM2_1_2]